MISFLGKQIQYDDSAELLKKRINSLFTKEPDTVEWISSLPSEDTFIDVGANVGMYSILAASKGMNVIAIEPESQNFAALNRNIHLNQFNNAKAYCAAVGVDGVQSLHLSKFEVGAAIHSANQDYAYKGVPTSVYVQGVLGVRLDQFGVNNYHVKIDVDGLEPEVVRQNLAFLLKAKSILIELDANDSRHMTVPDMLTGFSVNQSQVEKARRQKGPNAGVGNWIFVSSGMARAS